MYNATVSYEIHPLHVQSSDTESTFLYTADPDDRP